MKRLLTLFCVGAFLIVPIRAHARFWDGNYLVAKMRASERVSAGTSTNIGADQVDAGMFLGFVVGVADTGEALVGDKFYALPENPTAGQLCAVVSKYLKEHPEKWTRPAAWLVLDALTEAFPAK